MTEPDEDADVAIAAARAGATIIRARYGTVLRRQAKSATDFATDVDVQAEQVIRAVLRERRPDDAIQGEELGASGASDATRRWLVDPLCGTLNFAAHTPGFGVNVALTTGDATVGAVADPLSGTVFWTDGASTWVRDPDGHDEPARPSATSGLIDVNLDTADPDEHGFSPARYLGGAPFDRLRPRVLSSTLALAWVATGQRAGYVTAGRLAGSVHFTAGIALVQAAGGVVTNLVGAEMHTGIGGLVAAAGPDTHAALVQGVCDRLAGA